MVTGGAGGVVIKGGNMIFFEGRVESDAVAGFAALHVFTLDRAFMMAFLAGDLELKGVIRMLKHYRAAGIVQQHALGHRLARLRQQIAHNSHCRQNDSHQRNGQIPLLQRLAPLR